MQTQKETQKEMTPEATQTALTVTQKEDTTLIEAGDKANVYQFFGDFSTVIATAKELDEKILNVIYFLTDCNSTTVNDYRAYLLSEGVGSIKVKRDDKEELVSTKEATKKEIYAQLIGHIYNDLRGLLSKVNFHSSSVKTASLKDIETILKHYEWVIDLRFSPSDKPTERLKLIQTINKLWALDNHTKELKNADFVHYLTTKEKRPLFSKREIIALNTQTATLGHGIYSSFTANTLEQHISKTIKDNLKQWKEFYTAEDEQKLQSAKDSQYEEGYNKALEELKAKGLTTPEAGNEA